MCLFSSSSVYLEPLGGAKKTIFFYIMLWFLFFSIFISSLEPSAFLIEFCPSSAVVVVLVSHALILFQNLLRKI